MDYSQKLRELIQQSGITQVELANKLGVKQQTLSSWIVKRWPNLKSIEKICGGLGMEMWEFFIDADAIKKIYGLSPEALDFARAIDDLPITKKEKIVNLDSCALSELFFQ